MKQWKRTIVASVCAVGMLATGSLWAEAASVNGAEDCKPIRIQSSNFNIIDSSKWMNEAKTQEVWKNVEHLIANGAETSLIHLNLDQLLGSEGWNLPTIPTKPVTETPAAPTDTEDPGSSDKGIEQPQPKPEPSVPVVTEPTLPAPTPTPTPAPTPAPVVPEQPIAPEAPSAAIGQFEQQVVELVNIERTKAGLGAIQYDAELSAVAMDKAKDMFNNGYFSHQSPTYGSPFDMMDSYGIRYSYAGENIAKGQRTPEQVMNDWMNSQGHRENIMNSNFKSIGVAHYNGVWVQLFKG